MAYISDEEYAAMDREERTGAEFRAMRDKLGWTIRELATELGEEERVVSNWENPRSNWDVRPRAWQWMDRATHAFDATVRKRIDQAHGYLDATRVDTVSIIYRRNGMKRGGHYPAGSANAMARAVGDWLESEGYKVRYVWPRDAEDERFFDFEGKL